MSETLRRIQTLVLAEDVHVSDHGFQELRDDDILLADVLGGVSTAIIVEEYRARVRGPSILTFQRDRAGKPVHVVWALPRNERRPAVVVTAYRPNAAIWDDDFRRRR